MKQLFPRNVQIRSLEIAAILIFAWGLMLLIFILLGTVIVPLKSTTEWKTFVLGIFKVVIAGAAFFIWLSIWKTLIQIYFWKNIRNVPQGDIQNE